jgi:hypothetical protein
MLWRSCEADVYKSFLFKHCLLAGSKPESNCHSHVKLVFVLFFSSREIDEVISCPMVWYTGILDCLTESRF